MIRLKKNYITHKTGEGGVLLAIGKEANDFHKVVKLNVTALEIANLLSKPTDEETIVSMMAGTYHDVDRDLIAIDVKETIKQLRSLNVLDEE
ncbi:MAG: PqqD family protein [Bacilli bacterium]|nr:PqqD family protein [Bacilli bacterium]